MRREINIRQIVSSLKSVLKNTNMEIPLHEPLISGKEWDYVKESLDSGWVSSAGKFVEEFESQIVSYTGVKNAVAVVNGTAALHVCLKLMGIREGEEVLLPALTFVATANAVTYCGAIPHFIDSDANSLGIDTQKLNNYLESISHFKNGSCYNKHTSRPIKALICMHTFGHPSDLDSLNGICDKFNLELIEDSAQALGSFYKNKHVGNWGKVSALSFNGNKIITTGGGGAILTNDSDLAIRAKHITTTAKILHRWEYVHDQVGYNYRLPNINAALGCAQMEKLPKIVKQKRNLAKSYQDVFEGVEGVSVFKEQSHTMSNYWLNALILHEENVNLRNAILEETHKQGILTRPCWTLLNKLTMFKSCPQMDLSNAKKLETCIINIPSGPKLGGLDK